MCGGLRPDGFIRLVVNLEFRESEQAAAANVQSAKAQRNLEGLATDGAVLDVIKRHPDRRRPLASWGNTDVFVFEMIQ